MKTLKQLREENYDSFVPEQLVLEAKMREKSLVPSTKEMPPLLLFRRITYKIYPNKQVIALYYARSIDKYLSVPFGPGGNVNLSEAQIIEPDQLNENPALVGAALNVGKQFLSKGLSALSGVGSFLGGSDKPATDVKPSAPITPKLKPKTPSASKLTKPATDAVFKSKMKAYQNNLASGRMQENKMSDLRKMVREGVATKDLEINGRTITINTSIAKRILEVYDSVNTKNKKVMESMLNEDLDTFKKLLNFSVKA